MINQLTEAVLADPSSDAPRLILADYLDDRGDPRGEFIRVQCELARRPNKGDCPREHKFLSHEYLTGREQNLFRNAGLPGWFDNLPGAYRTTNPKDMSITTADGWTYFIRRVYADWLEEEGRTVEAAGQRWQANERKRPLESGLLPPENSFDWWLDDGTNPNDPESDVAEYIFNEIVAKSPNHSFHFGSWVEFPSRVDAEKALAYALEEVGEAHRNV